MIQQLALWIRSPKVTGSTNAKKTFQNMFLALFLVSFLNLGGCLDYESQKILMSIQPDLSGEVLYEFKGLHSTEEKEDARLQEMDKFYKEDHLDSLSELQSQCCLKEAKVEIYNKTNKACDAKAYGHAPNIISSLASLVQEAENFKIERDADHLYVMIQFKEKSMDDKTVLYIQYPNQVIKSNADITDSEKKNLGWNFKKHHPMVLEFEIGL